VLICQDRLGTNEHKGEEEGAVSHHEVDDASREEERQPASRRVVQSLQKEINAIRFSSVSITFQ
jgi:hypothetical protein